MTNGSHRQVRRRENLRKLIDENGGQAQVALEIGTPKSHLSAILAGRRGVGDALAQKIERHFERPEGWMDGDHGQSVPADVDQLALQIAALPKAQRDRVIAIARQAVEVAQELLSAKALAVTSNSQLDEPQQTTSPKAVRHG